MVEGKKQTGFIGQFLAIAKQEPELAAVESEGKGLLLTYGSLLAEMEYWHGYFKRLQVEKNERVIILLPSDVELIASFYGLVSAGGTAIPISCDATAYELEQIFLNASPVGIITTNALFTALGECIFSMKSLRFILVTDEVTECARENERVKLIGVPSIPRERIPIVVPEENPIICCQYTYKGLGYPLGVIHRYEDYTNGMECLERILYAKRGLIYLAVLPIHYIYTFTMSVLFPLSYGCKVVIVPELKNKSLLDLLERHQVHVCCMVPALLHKLVLEAKAIKKDRKLLLQADLMLFSGGSFLDVSLARKVFETIGIEPFQGYGLTETMPVTANYLGRVRRGSLGLPLSEKLSIYIMDEQEQEVPVGQAGEIVIGGFTLTEGYYKRPAETAQFLRNGLFYTGDLGFIDPEGFLFFLGRRCPITKIASKMTDLTEVENTLLLYPNVSQARVTVYEHSLSGENMLASLVLKDDSEVKKAELKQFCRERLSRHKIPSKFKIYRDIF